MSAPLEQLGRTDHAAFQQALEKQLEKAALSGVVKGFKESREIALKEGASNAHILQLTMLIEELTPPGPPQMICGTEAARRENLALLYGRLEGARKLAAAVMMARCNATPANELKAVLGTINAHVDEARKAYEAAQK